MNMVLKVSSFKYCRHIFKTLSKIGSRYNITLAGFININTGKRYIYISIYVQHSLEICRVIGYISTIGIIIVNQRRGSQIILHVSVQPRSLVEVKPYIIIYHSIFNKVFERSLLFQLSDV